MCFLTQCQCHLLWSKQSLFRAFSPEASPQSFLLFTLWYKPIAGSRFQDTAHATSLARPAILFHDLCLCMNGRTGGTMRAPPVHATPPGNCSFFHLLSGQLFELSFSWLTQLALFFFFFYWSFEMRTYLLNWEEMRNRGRKNSWIKQMEFRVLTIFFLLNDTVNRLSLKHENHKLLVAEAEESSLILLFFFIPHGSDNYMIYCPNWDNVENKRGTNSTGHWDNRNQLCPRQTGDIQLPYP